MKKVIMVMLFLLAFTISANAQETKSEKKASCCAKSCETASAEDKAKCHARMAEMTPEQAAECKKACDAAKKTASTNGQPNANTAVATDNKKSCASGKSCCAGKAKKA